MTGRLILLLVLTTLPQEPKKADDEAERAKRAAIVDQIMSQPIKARAARPALPVPPPAPAPAPAPARMMAIESMRRLTLELREVEAPDDGSEPPPNPGAMIRFNLQDLALSKDNFDRWLYEDALSEGARKNRLNTLLSDKIHTIEKERGIEAEGLRKLRLAGNGDIKRYFDRVDLARVEFDKARQDFNAGRTALDQLAPLASDYRTGPFGPGSIFEKTFQKIVQDGRKSTEDGEK